jgi:F-type H+-transporting ATPase subunit delta
MPPASDRAMAIARVYSEAILNLAEKQGDIDVILNELQDLVERLSADAGFREFLISPIVDADARQKAIERLFRGKYSDLFVDALQVLHRKGRLDLLPAIAESYRHTRAELGGYVEVSVASAVPLTHDLREKLRAAIAEKTGKTPDLIETVDESLIGGLVIRIGDQKFDDSLARHLRKLSAALQQRAAGEIHAGRTYWEGAGVARG